jgi:hypothetical protein
MKKGFGRKYRLGSVVLTALFRLFSLVTWGVFIMSDSSGPFCRLALTRTKLLGSSFDFRSFSLMACQGGKGACNQPAGCKGVRESESRTGTRLVSPSQRTQKKNPTPLYIGPENMNLKVCKKIQPIKLSYVALEAINTLI